MSAPNATTTTDVDTTTVPAGSSTHPTGAGHRMRAWPVLLLALPAFVAIWSGWVGLGGLTGFGVVRPLPGIWDSLAINTAVTLPIGMEAYAAFALRAWLSTGTPPRARRFARRSAIAALGIGAAGQVAYHLMTAAGITSAPWPITALVACLPVAVLGMGAALAHLLADQDDDHQQDAAVDIAADQATTAPGPAEAVRPAAVATRPRRAPRRSGPATTTARTGSGRVSRTEYTARARAALVTDPPDGAVTPAWVREHTGCSRGLSSAIAADLTTTAQADVVTGAMGADTVRAA